MLSAQADVAVPIHSLFLCEDRRYPVATDRWVLGCSEKGQVDSLWHFESRRLDVLPLSNHWLQGDALFRAGVDGGFWSVETQRFSGSRIFELPEDSAGRVNEKYVVLAATDSIVLLERTEGKTYTVAANPMGYQVPALLQEQVAWIEWSGDKKEILLWNWETQKKTAHPAGNPLYLESEGNILIWSEPETIQILDVETDERREIKTQSRGPLSIQNGRVCWAEWKKEDTDIRCSDGFVLEREGNQFSPIQLDKGLLFQEEQGIMWLSY